MWGGLVLSFLCGAEQRGSIIKQGAGQSGWSLLVCWPSEPWAPLLLMFFPNAPRLRSDAQLRLLGWGRAGMQNLVQEWVGPAARRLGHVLQMPAGGEEGGDRNM